MAAKKTKRKGSSAAGKRTPRRWSARVLARSNALDLELGVFKQRSGRAIAASLKRSALASKRARRNRFAPPCRC